MFLCALWVKRNRENFSENLFASINNFSRIFPRPAFFIFLTLRTHKNFNSRFFCFFSFIQSTSQRRKEKSTRLAARYLLSLVALAWFTSEFGHHFRSRNFLLILESPPQSHNDLNYMNHCEFAYHLKKDEICINPYHYSKVEPEFIQPQSPQQHQQLSILVPKFPTSSPESSSVSSYLDDLSNTVPLNTQYNALKWETTWAVEWFT